MVVTPPGSNVTVQPGNGKAKIKFGNVSAGGVTTMKEGPNGPALPAGASHATSVAKFYDLSTTATFDTATVEISYVDSTLTGDESSIQLLHYDETAMPPAWVDITTGHDIVGNHVTGKSSSLSPFVLAYGTTVAVDDGPAVVAFRLYPGQPNPMTNQTTLRFDLPAASRVRMRVLDVRGRLVRDLVSGRRFEAGRHRAPWDGRTVSGQVARPGIYFVEFEAGGFRATQRLVRLR